MQPRSRPDEAEVRVILHLPVFGESSVDVDREPQAGDDLKLQGYSSELREELRRSFPHRVIVTQPGEAPATIEQQPVMRGDVRLIPAGAQADAWSVGATLVTSVYRVQAPDRSWAELGRAVEHARAELRAGVDAGLAGRAAADGRAPQSLWMHALLIVEMPADTEAAELDAIASALTLGGPAFAPGPAGDPTVLRLGLDACVAGTDGLAEVADAATRVIAAHSAVWAAAIDLDRRLRRELTTTRAVYDASLPQLEAQAADLLRFYERVRAFRAGLDNVAVHLALVDGRAWRAVADTWGLESQLLALSDKLEALHHIYGELTSALAGRRARRLNDFVIVFTFATVVTAGMAAVSFVQRPLQSPKATAALVVVALALVAAALWWWLRRILRAAERRKTTVG